MFNFNIKKICYDDELGSGSSGTVYPYQKDPSDKRWVVKHIVTYQAKEVCHRVNEIVLGFDCNHSNVLTTRGYFLDFNQQRKIWNIYIKLPRMTSSLKKIIDKHISNKTCIPLEEIIKYFYAIIRGLQYLHEKGIAHRNLKPENLLLDENNALKISGFGLANLVRGKASGIVDKAGTMFFAAPENKDRNGEIKKKDLFKADYWSLGMVMLELCSLDVRDLRAIKNQDEVMGKIQKLKEKHKDRYKNELFDLIESLLQWEPSKRRTLESVQEYLELRYPEIIQTERDNKQIILEQKTEFVKLKEMIKDLEEKLKARIFSDGRKYEGEWENDQKEGQRTLTWPNGNRYEGESRDGLRHGKGTLIYSDGLKYEGQWKNDKKVEQGIQTWLNGDRYEGEWNDDLRHGTGTLMFSDGRKYEGQWKNDKKEGQGIFTWSNGARYEGEYKNDVRHGKGTHIFSDGCKYEGEWKSDKSEGQGVYTWPDGGRYEGEFHDDAFHGKGTLLLSDGRKYEGEWKNEKREGQGILTWPYGDRYEGEWKNGKIEGQGIFTWSNGDRYEGEFRDDMRHGKGVLTHPDGRKQIGIWSSDKFIEK